MNLRTRVLVGAVLTAALALPASGRPAGSTVETLGVTGAWEWVRSSVNEAVAALGTWWAARGEEAGGELQMYPWGDPGGVANSGLKHYPLGDPVGSELYPLTDPFGVTSPNTAPSAGRGGAAQQNSGATDGPTLELYPWTDPVG